MRFGLAGHMCGATIRTRQAKQTLARALMSAFRVPEAIEMYQQAVCSICFLDVSETVLEKPLETFASSSCQEAFRAVCTELKLDQSIEQIARRTPPCSDKSWNHW